MSNRTRVFFVQQIAENKYETESLWCKVEDNLFIVDNIPLIAERSLLVISTKESQKRDMVNWKKLSHHQEIL